MKLRDLINTLTGFLNAPSTMIRKLRLVALRSDMSASVMKTAIFVG